MAVCVLTGRLLWKNITYSSDLIIILFSKSFTNVYHFSYSTKGWTYQRDVMGYSEGCVIWHWHTAYKNNRTSTCDHQLAIIIQAISHLCMWLDKYTLDSLNNFQPIWVRCDEVASLSPHIPPHRAETLVKNYVMAENISWSLQVKLIINNVF